MVVVYPIYVLLIGQLKGIRPLPIRLIVEACEDMKLNNTLTNSHMFDTSLVLYLVYIAHISY